MKWSVARGIGLALAALLTVCGGWLWLAPTSVGGPMSLVVTSGVSMQPTFHTGDLAVLRTSSTYHVGDIVGYHSRTLKDAVVLHRLVAADGARWTTKGDHNTWLDPDHPTDKDIVGKLWLHVPKGGFLLTRVLTPLAFVAFLGLLIPWRKRSGTDENGDPTTDPAGRPTGSASRGRHASNAGLRFRSDLISKRLSRQGCTRALAGGLTLAIVGAVILIVGAAHPLHRASSIARTWQTTAAFGWTGTTGDSLVYPGGRVTDPAPIYPRLLDRITMTAKVTSHGRPLGAPTLTATLSDASGWSAAFPIEAETERRGPAVQLSAPLDLHRLLNEVAWVQAMTGVSSPATLTLSVGESGQVSAARPSLGFAISAVTLKPQGALTVTKAGTTSTPASVPATLTVSGHHVAIGRVRQTGATALAVGLIVALAAGLLSRRTSVPSEQDRLLQLFTDRVVRLAASPSWERDCLEVADEESLAAFAATPSAVLYVVGSSGRQVLIAERGGTRLRYVPRVATDPAPRGGSPSGPAAPPESPFLPEQRAAPLASGPAPVTDVPQH